MSGDDEAPMDIIVRTIHGKPIRFSFGENLSQDSACVVAVALTKVRDTMEKYFGPCDIVVVRKPYYTRHSERLGKAKGAEMFGNKKGRENG